MGSHDLVVETSAVSCILMSMVPTWHPNIIEHFMISYDLTQKIESKITIFIWANVNQSTLYDSYILLNSPDEVRVGLNAVQ